MDKIAFEAISKQFAGAGKPAVNAVSFAVPEGVTCMLVGTSGAGKTTLLRMVNRLIEPSAGRILIDGRNILEENPILLRRRIGYVIQQIGLFPHLNVQENIRVTAEVAGGWTRPRLDVRVDDLLALVGLPPAEYRNRFPRELSGGQQQRVGLARALATDPAVLLMDEPFGALDAITRTHMQDELLRIQHNVRKTILFVTHDMDEAFKLGDRIAVLDDGKLVQLGSPVDLLTRPANDLVRRLVGADNMLRQLEYLPVSDALASDSAETWRWQDAPRCAPGASLLTAMLMLLETNAPALAVQGDDGGPVHYVTLGSITAQVTRLRGQAAGVTKVQA